MGRSRRPQKAFDAINVPLGAELALAPTGRQRRGATRDAPPANEIPGNACDPLHTPSAGREVRIEQSDLLLHVSGTDQRAGPPSSNY